jgi:hypothetical protein
MLAISCCGLMSPGVSARKRLAPPFAQPSGRGIASAQTYVSDWGDRATGGALFLRGPLAPPERHARGFCYTASQVSISSRRQKKAVAQTNISRRRATGQPKCLRTLWHDEARGLTGKEYGKKVACASVLLRDTDTAAELALSRASIQAFEERTRMPRYYFHLVKGDRRIPDLEGIDLYPEELRPDALLQIFQELRSTEEPNLVEDWRGWSLEIADAAGQVLQIILI